MGIASMVIGIVAVVVGFFPFCGTWALVPALVGLGLGIADLVVKTQARQPRGMAITGVILNPLAIVVILMWYFLVIYGTAKVVDSAANAFGAAIQQQAQQMQASVPSVPVQPAQPMQPMQPVPAQPAPSQPAPTGPAPTPQPPALAQ
ncbi:MAG: hypothetical protein PHU25_18590 [Deltaproteobacteria bacterium]|nr:hypothetical protein [Deltaproteobacteria bacterium]